jgi:N-acetylmuramoyl-L-alanine amidase
MRELMWALLLVGCPSPVADGPPVPDAALQLPDRPPPWPERGAPLVEAEVVFPEGFGTRRVFLDPGHGVGDNVGAETVGCALEEEVNLEVALDLARRLEAMGHFEVRLARTTVKGPAYPQRVEDAQTWGADVLLSLHTDWRGEPWRWKSAPDRTCQRNDAVPLVEGRRVLARSLAQQMAEAGMTPYDGFLYGDRYEPDEVPGVFLDRRRLYMLHQPQMPSAIIETHHGLHLDEWSRWREDPTRAVFATAVAAALVELVEATGDPAP